MIKWQPIETAPRDQKVLLYYPPASPRKGQKEYTLPEMMRVDYVGATPRQPTHWAEINPPSPKDNEA